jgi:hypothetical protein
MSLAASKKRHCERGTSEAIPTFSSHRGLLHSAHFICGIRNDGNSLALICKEFITLCPASAPLRTVFSTPSCTFNNPQITFADSYVTFADTNVSFNDSHILFNDSHGAFNDSHISFNDANVVFNDSNVSFNDSNVLFNDSHVAFNGSCGRAQCSAK